ncbi:hypothetical protein [Streptosporangium sp. NPDC050280]|uniref:hypothetical protein n=1 Tax=unclassified Streptosporangium TaxID=2632669 RepID=UPI00343CCF93
MRNGRIYARPTSAPRTGASGGSAWPGLHTPRARDSKGRGFPDGLPTPMTSEGTGADHAAQGGMNLRHTVSLLPTPRASERENRQTKRSPSQEAGTHGLCLAAEVASLLPTPRVAATRTSRSAIIRPDSRSSPSLDQAIELASGILPRELVSLEEAPGSWHGVHTSLPSDAGSTSSDDLPLGQLTIDDALPPPSSSG